MVPQTEQLKQAFASYGLPVDAVRWLLDLWLMIQLFDDYADGDAVTREDLDRLIVTSLIKYSSNNFYLANHEKLTSSVMSLVLKWKASDAEEVAGKATEKTFVWRAGYWDTVLLVVALCHGVDKTMNHAHEILNLYGETYADYVKEFGHAR